MDSPTVKTLTISCSGAGLVASASYSPNCAVFEPGAKHTFDEGVGESATLPTAEVITPYVKERQTQLPQDHTS